MAKRFKGRAFHTVYSNFLFILSNDSLANCAISRRSSATVRVFSVALQADLVIDHNGTHPAKRRLDCSISLSTLN